MPVALHFPGVGPGSCPYHRCAFDGSLEASGVMCAALHAFLPKGKLLGPGQAEYTADSPTSLPASGRSRLLARTSLNYPQPPTTTTPHTLPLAPKAEVSRPRPEPRRPTELSTDFSVMSHLPTFGPSCLCEVAHRDVVPILQINKLEAPGNELVASPGLS